MDRNNDRSPAFLRWLKKGGWIVIVDILLGAALLVGFAYLHHGMERTEFGSRLVSCRSGVVYKLDTGFDAAFDESDTGIFSFDNRFVSRTPSTTVNGDTTYYKDDRCEIAITNYNLESGRVQVADIYISDISKLQTSMAHMAYGKGIREDPMDMAAREGAVFSITGDNYSERYGGVVMRNGVLYSGAADRDVCVLNWDGTMDLYTQAEFDLPAVMEKGAYQIWSFGPILVEDGEAAGEYITDMLTPGRRAAIGYYEPGHYCFVIMDGEITIEELADTMVILGCESAYSLYGGRLAEMSLSGEIISTDQEADRECSDIIMIVK